MNNINADTRFKILQVAQAGNGGNDTSKGVIDRAKAYIDFMYPAQPDDKAEELSPPKSDKELAEPGARRKRRTKEEMNAEKTGLLISITSGEVKAATFNAIDKLGPAEVTSIYDDFGISQLPQLKEEDYPSFMAALKEKLELL